VPFSFVAIVGSWAWFLFLAYCGQIGGFGTHYLTPDRQANIRFRPRWTNRCVCTEGKEQGLRVAFGFPNACPLGRTSNGGVIFDDECYRDLCAPG
jgi:hypothetical protein